MKGRYDNLRRIEKLDPEVEHDEIYRLVAWYEFPWEVVQGTSLAFMRDYGVRTNPVHPALRMATDAPERSGRPDHRDHPARPADGHQGPAGDVRRVRAAARR